MRHLERATKAIWDYWWFVLVLWAVSSHGRLTLTEVWHTALIWSGLELLSVPVRIFASRWRAHRRQWRGYRAF